MRQRGRTTLAVVAAVVLSACGGPSLGPVGEGPDDTAAGGPVDGCRPPLGEDDPHPIQDSGGGGQHPALAGDWVQSIAEEVQTEHVDVLGGLWLDNDAGELVIMVPGTDGREVFERLRAEAPEPERVVCMEAAATATELEELQQEAFARLSDAGANMSGGTDVVRSVVEVMFEGDPEVARDALGDLADDPRVRLTVPPCAEIEPTPEGAVDLAGDGSNCQGMDALFIGTLAGDPASGCAWFEDDQGQPQTVLWPRGWSITEDGTILDHRGEPRASLGDEIESGGGHTALPEGQRACGMGGDGAWVVSSLTPVDDGGAGE